MWLAVRYRRLQALMLLALSALITACTVLAPLYDRAMQQALTRLTVDAASSSATAIQVAAMSRFNSGVDIPSYLPASHDELASLLPESARPWFMPRIDASSLTVVRVDRAAKSPVGELLWRDGACAHVSWTAGGCPRASGDIAVSAADAKTFALGVGSTIKVEERPRIEQPAQAPDRDPAGDRRLPPDTRRLLGRPAARGCLGFPGPPATEPAVPRHLAHGSGDVPRAPGRSVAGRHQHRRVQPRPGGGGGRRGRADRSPGVGHDREGGAAGRRQREVDQRTGHGRRRCAVGPAGHQRHHRRRSPAGTRDGAAADDPVRTAGALRPGAGARRRRRAAPARAGVGPAARGRAQGRSAAGRGRGAAGRPRGCARGRRRRSRPGGTGPPHGPGRRRSVRGARQLLGGDRRRGPAARRPDLADGDAGYPGSDLLVAARRADPGPGLVPRRRPTPWSSPAPAPPCSRSRRAACRARSRWPLPVCWP